MLGILKHDAERFKDVETVFYASQTGISVMSLTTSYIVLIFFVRELYLGIPVSERY